MRRKSHIQNLKTQMNLKKHHISYVSFWHVCFLLACLVFTSLGIDVNVGTCDVSETHVLCCPKLEFKLEFAEMDSLQCFHSKNC